jgi:hypothetical protein
MRLREVVAVTRQIVAVKEIGGFACVGRWLSLRCQKEQHASCNPCGKFLLSRKSEDAEEA